MNVIAIECSCRHGSIAILEDGTLVKLWKFESPRGRGTELFTHLESALRECGTPSLVTVGTGPGSYNGLRTSIAAAWGVARARSAQLAGVPTLLGYDAPEYFVAGDARANQWFLAHVENGKFLSPPTLYSPQEVLGLLKPGTPVFTTSGLQALPDATVAAPCAGILGLRDFAEGLPVPAYLKPPHITKPKFR